MPSRRSCLVGLGLSLGLAGCLGTDVSVSAEQTGSPAPPSASKRHSFGDEVAVGDARVTPLSAHVQSSALYVSNTDWASIHHPDDQWLLFVKLFVDASESRPPRDSFRLVSGDRSFVPRDSLAGVSIGAILPDAVVDARPYDPERTSTGWLVFSLPTEFEAASALTLRAEHAGTRAHWSLPEKATASVAESLPTFELVSFDVPKRVSAVDSVEVTVTARNTGDVGGVFRGCVNTTGMYTFHSVELPVEAGAEATWTESLYAADYAPDGGSFSCLLRTAADDDQKRTVAVDSDVDTTDHTESNSARQ